MEISSQHWTLPNRIANVGSPTSKNHCLPFLSTSAVTPSHIQKPLTLLRIRLPLGVNLQIDLLLISEFRIAICYRRRELASGVVIFTSLFKLCYQPAMMFFGRSVQSMSIF